MKLKNYNFQLYKSSKLVTSKFVDAAIASLTSRFEQLQKFEKIFGFLLNSVNLKFLDDNDLQKCCTSFV